MDETPAREPREPREPRVPHDTHGNGHDIIVIGSSNGGIEALSRGW